MKPRVGVIGTGIMGKPLARNLMKAGFPVVAHNRSRSSVEELAREGATAASSPKEVVHDVARDFRPDERKNAA